MADNNTTEVQTSAKKTDKFFNMSRMRRIIANMKNYIDTRLKEKADAKEVKEMMEIEEIL